MKQGFHSQGLVSLTVDFSTEQVGSSNPSLYQVRREDGAGFFATLGTVLTQLAVSEWLAIHPVVDLRKGSAYLEANQVLGTNNVWEYYFEQVGEYGLTDLDSGNFRIIRSETHHPILSEVNTGEWYRSLWNKYVRLNETTETHIHSWSENLGLGPRSLGVHIRTGDMRTFPGHPFPPTLDQLVGAVRETFESGDFDDIYVAAQDHASVRSLRQHFGKRVKESASWKWSSRADSRSSPFSQSSRLSKRAVTVQNSRAQHRYLLGLEALGDCFLLSKCGALVSGNSNVAHWSVILSESRAKKWLKLSNGWNSRNPLVAPWLWAVKSAVPPIIGGFSKRFEVE